MQAARAVLAGHYSNQLQSTMSQAINWQRMHTFIQTSNTEHFLQTLADQLRSGNKQFGILQKGLRAECFEQFKPDTARQFLCNALLSVLEKSELAEGDTAVAHLLLEAAPIQRVDRPQPPSSAPRLFSSCCCLQHARLAVKSAQVAQVFSMQWNDIEDHQHCKLFVCHLLEDKALYTPAVGLLLHFPELQEGTDIGHILHALVEDGQLGLAQKWAQTLPQAFQISLVNQCVHVDRLKEAVKLVRHLKLQETFPDIDEMYKQRTLNRLLEKEQWEVAATYAGQDRHCQEQVVRAIALAGELARAEEVREQFGLSPAVLNVDSAEADAQRAIAAATYLAMPLPASSVLFVNDDMSIASARDVLQSAHVVGLDVEWKPNTSGAQNPASLLQVATHCKVLLFDLLKLHGNQALDDCLSSLLQNSSTVKLGCRLSDDVSKLHRSYPDMQAFKHAVTLLDLTAPWTLYMQTYNQDFQGRRRGSPVGLSTMAQSVLGKPLNKAMQMSDWERRPLTSKQTEYAALDAFVLLQIYDVITAPSHGLTQPQLEPFVYSYVGHKRQQRGQANSPDKDPLTDDQHHKRHAMQQNISMPMQHGAQSGADAGCQPEITPPARKDMGASESSTVSMHPDTPETAADQCGQEQAVHCGATESAGDVSGSGHDMGQAQLHTWQQQRYSELKSGAAVTLPAGSPLQQLLQDNALEDAVKLFPSRAG